MRPNTLRSVLTGQVTSRTVTGRNVLPGALALFVGLVSSGCCGPLMFHGGCDSGCGQCYVDPWINEPAQCCDPCDACGNYGGQSCSSCRPVFAGIKTIWGYRYGGGGCGGCDLGCDGCAGMDPSCGLEPGCGFEPGCGMEPGCGLEGCPDCGMSHGIPMGDHGFVQSHPSYGDSVVEYDPAMESSRVIVPRDRRTAARPVTRRR